MKLYIFRHGETSWNNEGRLQGQTDIELNDYGRELARLTAEATKEINYDLIYSSPLVRAYETAVILRGNRDISIITDDRLKEVSFGEGEGCKVSDRPESLADFFKAPEKYKAVGKAEPIEDLLGRTKDFLDRAIFPLAALLPNSNVIISGHGALNKALSANLLNRPVDRFWEGPYQKNCSLTLFEIGADGSVELLEEGKIFYDERSKTDGFWDSKF